MTDYVRIVAGILAMAIGVLVAHDLGGLYDALGAALAVGGLVTLGRIGT